MTPATAIICLVILVIVIFSVKSYLKKLQHGCCGGGDAPEKVKTDDRNPAHYLCHRVVTVEGMTCAHCVQHVENAFNAKDGVMARVNLSKKRADVYSKAPLEDSDIRQIVARAGYAVTSIA